MFLSGSVGKAVGVAINLTFFDPKGCRTRDSTLIFYYESHALYTAPLNQLKKKKKKFQFMEPKQMRHY